MKRLFFYLILFIFISLISMIVVLTTIGIETNKFNKFIINKAAQTKNIDLELTSIKFKIDPKELSLFLETQKPKIAYSNISVPLKNIKVYIDFLSLLKSNPKIKKTNLILEELDIRQLNKLSAIIKPSNFKSLLNNKIQEGKLISEIEIFLKEDGSLNNFIAKGNVKNLKIELFNDFNLTKTNLSFFADKNDVLIKNISGNLEDIIISDGTIKLNLEKSVILNSNFNSRLKLNKKLLRNKYTKYLNKYEFVKNIEGLDAELNNNFSINFDNTYKVKDYNYTFSGVLKKIKYKFLKSKKYELIDREIKEIYFSDLKTKASFKSEGLNFNSAGKYSFDDLDFQKITINNMSKRNNSNYKLDIDYKDNIKFDLINYQKPTNTIANLILDIEKKKDDLNIKNINFSEENSKIKISGLKFKKNKFISFKNIDVSTKNNNFSIKKKNIISIIGSKFDATNLAKFLNNKESENKLTNINSDIEIDFKNIKAPMSEKLQNFKLIGEIKNGQFVKISSKGDFGGNNFLDISMKKDENSNKRYLEIYSDLPRPLLSEYSFFKGLSGGKLLFNSIIDGSKSNSELKIENFKVINAPGMIKLLSLADLGGLADLAEGEGLSFDLLEIDLEKNKNLLKLNEIMALGPSISVLMEGYQDENGLTSLRGTLVPAKTLNKMISRIPVIGSIVIPKEVGEGLFGISFKMKGFEGKLKTTINPIRSLTPRFIQKIIDKNKEAK